MDGGSMSLPTGATATIIFLFLIVSIPSPQYIVWPIKQKKRGIIATSHAFSYIALTEK